jgi:MFS family permease
MRASAAVSVNGSSRPAWPVPDRALAALGHPLSLGAIVLLLLNDHFLKGAFPSVLTGKLSDFAGLFFFPFLLAAVVGPIAGRVGRPRRADAAMAASFVVTASCFALIKVDASCNVLAARLLEAVLGGPVRLVRDPTDLIALAALWPAWRLWRSVPERRHGNSPRSLLALGLASLAALATAPCLPEMPVSHLVATEAGVYALTSPWNPEEGVYRSSTGSGWEAVHPSDVPPEIIDAAAAPVELPKVACVPDLEQTCYRAAAEEQLLASSDGGATWQVVWSAPAARRSFMQRVADGYGQLLYCGKDLDFRATDVVVLGRGPEHVVVVALGNEGVLHGRLGGPWSRQGVGAAEATPERGGLQDVLSPSLILGETLAAILAGAAALLLFSSLAWRRFRLPPEEGGPRRSDLPWKTGAVVTLLIFILMFSLGIEELIPYALVPLIGFVAWAVVLWSGWLQTLRGTTDRRRAWMALGLAVLGSLLVALALWIPFALWVLGMIPGYPGAAGVALAAAAGVTAIFWRIMGRREAPASSA